MNRTVIAYLALLVLGIVLPFFVSPVLVMKVLCFALFACAFNLLLGYTGLLSFGHAAFFGTAAYVAGYAIRGWGFPPELGILAGPAACALHGWVVGSLAIRRTGIYFAMVTLALAQMVYFFFLQAPFTGGEDGLQGVPSGKLLGLISLANDLDLYYFVLAIFVFGFCLIYRTIHSPFGQILKAIRENEPRAISLGYDVAKYKLLAFVLSAGLAGLAGMVGGTESDPYVVDSLSDIVVELAGGGTGDRVSLTVAADYRLADNVETLVLLNAATIGNGNALANTIVGNGLANILTGFAGNDTLLGGAGNDKLDGRDGNDRMEGEAGNDAYLVDSSGDIIVELANSGTDTVTSTLMSYTLGANLERLVLTDFARTGTGNGLANTLSGNRHANTLSGGDGNDTLSGSGGNDTLSGGAGNDLLAGGSGTDTLTGGGGQDQFRFDTALSVAGVDRITDFSVTDDTLVLDHRIFTTLVEGPLAADAFRIGPSAGDASDRIIYNSATGALLYDADGTGAAAGTQFATLSMGLALTRADILVV